MKSGEKIASYLPQWKVDHQLTILDTWVTHVEPGIYDYLSKIQFDSFKT